MKTTMVTNSNDYAGLMLFLISLLLEVMDSFFSALGRFSMVAGIISFLLTGSWFLSLHMNRIQTEFDGDWRLYLKTAFNTKKPNKKKKNA